MATAITSPTYDPIPTATNLADKYVASRQQNLTTQLATATAADRGLTEMNSALLAFQTSLTALTGANKTVFAQSAVFGDTTIGTATATSKAAAGTYAFFVKQIATASQVSFTGLTDSTGVGGTLKLNMGGALAFEVDMAAADTDGNGLSTRELAAAINAATGNAGKVTASIVTTGGTSELVLTAKDTGLNSAITLNTSGITGTSSLAAANADATRRRVLVQAQDAEIRVGTENGTAITQASNTFTAIDGVSMTFTKAHAAGAAPVSLTVSADNTATTANVQAFVDAYNKLKTALNKLTDSGDAANGVAGGAFAHDSGVRALNDRLTALLRPVNGESLAAYGIISTRTGTLELNAARLTSQLAVKPEGLDALIGASSASNPTGVAGALDDYLKSWSSSVDGQIKLRREQTATQQSRLSDRQASLDDQHEAAYQRYLRQFTQLQTMQSVMNNNVSLFDALFGSDSD
jgi:flagellar hook-associated protein 2